MNNSAPNLTISDTHLAICASSVRRVLVDELAVDVAGVEIGGANRHDRGGDQRADANGGERDADKPGREDVQDQRRHGEAVAELLEAAGEFGERADAGGNGEEAEQRQKSAIRRTK